MRTSLHITTSTESFMQAPNGPLAKLVHAVIHRIECPLQPATKQARTATFGKRMVGKSAYRTGMIRDRQLSHDDKADVAQQALASIVIHCNQTGDFSPLCPFRQADISRGEVPIVTIFRQARHMLGMNGGKHDRSRIDSISELEANGPELAAPSASEDSHDRLAALREELEEMALASFQADTSRTRKAAYESARQIIAHLCGESTDLVFNNRESRKKNFTRFRSYLSIPCKGNLQKERETFASDLARAMSAL